MPLELRLSKRTSSAGNPSGLELVEPHQLANAHVERLRQLIQAFQRQIDLPSLNPLKVAPLKSVGHHVLLRQASLEAQFTNPIRYQPDEPLVGHCDRG